MTSLTQLLSQLADLGIVVSLDGEELLVKAPRHTLTPQLKQDLLDHKAGLLEFLRASASQAQAAPQPGDRMPLSHAQQRIWFLHQLEPASAVWNVASVFLIEGTLNISALERALAEVVSRHSLLRSTFHAVDGIPFTRIAPLSQWSLTRRVASQAEALAHAQAAAVEPFDLQAGPLFRAVLFEAEPDRHYLTLAIHHIACDGWSLGVLSREISQLHSAFRHGHDSPLRPPSVQYSHYVDWEKASSTQVSQADMDWWREKLAGQLPLLELGDRRNRSAVPNHEGRRISLAIPQADTSRLHLLARECGVTSFMLLLAAFKVLLYRYTGVDDIVIGTATSYRKRQEFEQLVGMFANTIVLRTSLAGDPSFHDVLDRVRETVVAAFSHDTIPFDRMIEQLHPDRNALRSPLFQVSFAYQNLPPAEMVLEGTRVSQQRVEIPHARYDLSVEIWTTATGMSCDFEFRSALFDVSAIERMQDHFLRILRSALAHVETRVSNLAMLSDSERTTLLENSNGAPESYPAQSIDSLFEEQCKLNPEAPALADDRRTVTYTELNTQANALAAELNRIGVQAGATVAILIERSVESICAMLAILKIGAAYLVLDTHDPKERLRLLVSDAGAQIALIHSGDSDQNSHGQHSHSHFDDLGSRILDTASVLHTSITAPPHHAALATTLNRSMCLLYTSGSTGTPKGVDISHRGLVRLLFSHECRSFGSGEAVLHMAPQSFDASLLEIWGPLVHGGCSVISHHRHPELVALRSLLQKHAVRAAWLTSSLFNWIVDQDINTLSSLQRIYTGGEALSVSHVRRAYQALPSVTIFNGYGPTEATVFTCLYAIPRELPHDLVSVPIGRPVANTSAYVLDSNLQLVAHGLAGELYIGGDALALGYRNRPDLNSEKFIPDPFTTGGRLFRSGDRCAYLADGTLQFLGRLDGQLKVRGHRVEPGEIEAAISGHPAVSACAVTLRKDAQRNDMVVAWFAGDPDLQPEALRATLKQTLPAYMIPNLIVRLDELPLLQNGKVDRQALSATPLPSSSPDTEPDSGFDKDIVQLIAQAMAEVLGVQHVGKDDDFFALGGHSLLAMQLIARIEALLARRISAALLFQSATPRAIARFLEDQSTFRPQRLLPLRTSGDRVPLFCLHLLLDGSIHDYLALVRSLDDSQPVYGLCPGEFDLSSVRVWTLPRIAAEYIKEVKRLRPHGPWHLCGYSSAGMLAFEMARQLDIEGSNVKLLLLDSFPPANLRSLSLVEMYRMVRLFVGSQGRRGIATRLLLRACRHLYNVTRNFLAHGTPTRKRKVEDPDQALLSMLNRAMKTYRSRAYFGHAVLFKAQQEGHYQRFNFDGSNNWKRLVRGRLELRLIPGNHRQIMQHPSVDLLAEQLQQSLRDP